MKKLVVFLVVALLLSGTALASVTRTTVGTTVTYSSNTLTGSYTKAYWAVEEQLSGCSITSVSCTGENYDCNMAGTTLKITSYVSQNGGTVGDVDVEFFGTEACTLNNGQYVESSPGNLGTATALLGSAQFSLGGNQAACDHAADEERDCTISLAEVIAYAEQWIANSGPTLTQVISTAEIWVAGGTY